MLCLPTSPQWTDSWETHWEKMRFWDPLKIHVFPITLNSENLSFAKSITMGLYIYFWDYLIHFCHPLYEGSDNHGFNMFPCIFNLARVMSDFAIQKRPVSLCSFTSVPGGALGLWVWSPLGESRKVIVSAEITLTSAHRLGVRTQIPLNTVQRQRSPEASRVL